MNHTATQIFKREEIYSTIDIQGHALQVISRTRYMFSNNHMGILAIINGKEYRNSHIGPASHEHSGASLTAPSHSMTKD